MNELNKQQEDCVLEEGMNRYYTKKAIEKKHKPCDSWIKNFYEQNYEETHL